MDLLGQIDKLVLYVSVVFYPSLDCGLDKLEDTVLLFDRLHVWLDSGV